MILEKNKKILHEGLVTLGITAVNLEIVENTLCKYVLYVEQLNPLYKVSAARSQKELIVNHVLDSLAPFLQIKKLLQAVPRTQINPLLADIGSGGGFPGIPLAIVFPHVSFTLIERMTKRCDFLEQCKNHLNLNNIIIQNIEAERIPHAQFDGVVFRAFHPFEKKLIKVLLRIIKSGGFIGAYKAKKNNIETELQSIAKFVQNYKIYPLLVPFLDDHERNFVVITK